MQTRFIIDTIVHQTTILIAELATAAGIRAPLSHVANQVFLDLARAIENQGVPRKVAADMFGLALRSYQLKVQRLEESATDKERSLWEAVFDFISQSEIVSRVEILTRFRHDPGASVRSILNDLVETGLVFQTGSGNSTAYRAATDKELAAMAPTFDEDALPWLLWVTIYRAGPQTARQLAESSRITEEEAHRALQSLQAQGVIIKDHQGLYLAEQCQIPLDESAGWGAAVVDHFRAMVVALSQKLREQQSPTTAPEFIGGSTYSFDIYKGHPFEEEALNLLQNFRHSLSELRQKIAAHNNSQGREPITHKVTFYLGQSVIAVDDGPAL